MLWYCNPQLAVIVTVADLAVAAIVVAVLFWRANR